MLGSASDGWDATTNMIKTMPTMQPAKIPAMVREGFLPADSSKCHTDGRKYCVLRIAVRMKAWRANMISLKATAGVWPS